MADIGATLREARTRARIDITDMEVETKIRAKYLRALENEEWDTLPGPAYVKSFLRTYAEALGLDAKRILEEYKVRHERPADADLAPIRAPSARDRRRRGGEPRRRVPGWALIAVVLVAIFAALGVLGSTGGEDPASDRAAPRPAQDREPSGRAGDADRGRDGSRERSRPRNVRLRLVPTAPVSVCLVDARGRVLVRNELLAPGSPTRTFRSRRFRMVLGNNAVRLVVNGRSRSLPASSEAIARQLTRTDGLRPLAAARRPSCS